MIKEKGIKHSYSLTQHGGSSGISKIERRDPSYRIITRQGLGFQK